MRVPVRLLLSVLVLMLALPLSAQDSRLRLNGTGSAEGIDFDGNGKFDDLVVNIGVDAEIAGFYQYSVSLTDVNGVEIGYYENVVELQAGSNTLSTFLDGIPIGENAVDGPYLFANFTMSDTFDAGITLSAPVAYTTDAYKASDFEGFTGYPDPPAPPPPPPAPPVAPPAPPAPPVEAPPPPAPPVEAPPPPAPPVAPPAPPAPPVEAPPPPAPPVEAPPPPAPPVTPPAPPATPPAPPVTPPAPPVTPPAPPVTPPAPPVTPPAPPVTPPAPPVVTPAPPVVPPVPPAPPAPPRDGTAPTVRVSVTPSVIWPPDHKMVEIHMNVVASDDTDSHPVVTYVGTVCNQAIASGDISYSNGRLFVRSERTGRTEDRVYTITYSARDAAGNVSRATATVTVPHDQGH